MHYISLTDLVEQPCVHFVVKTNDHLLPHQHRRGAKISSWAEHHFQQFFFGGLRFLQVDFYDLFTFGSMNRRSTRNQLKCFGLLMDVFFGIDDEFGFDASVCKKLLRFRAGLSATTVVAPVNFLRHRKSMFGNRESTFDNATRNASNTPDNIVRNNSIVKGGLSS